MKNPRCPHAGDLPYSNYWSLIQRTFHFYHFVRFYNVPHFDVVEILDVQTTFEALTDFLRIVLKSLQRA